MSEYTVMRLARRLWWDLVDPLERQYLLYSFIFQVPGLFGDMLRARFVSKRIAQCGKNLLVQAGTRFRSMEKLKLGNNVIIGYDNFIQARGGVTIGDNSFTGPGVKIWSVNHDVGDVNMPIQQQGSKAAEVIIGKDVWIASNAFILPGVNLPDGVVVSAGSVVGAKPYRPYSILAGNPARAMGFRGGNPVEGATGVTPIEGATG